MAALKSPKSNRAIYKIKIGTRNVYCRVKKSTADVLGLKAVDGIQQNKTAVIRGAKGTKSYTLYLRSKTTVKGVAVLTLDFPVDGNVKL